jgi:uridylate kinase
MPAIYKRILLKISGESLAGDKKSGLDNATLHRIGSTIRQLESMGVQVAVVVGGGNFWRGRTSEGMDRVTADHMGMLATAMNALALADALEQAGAVTRVISAIEMRQFAEPYIRKRAVRHLEKGRVVIFACGTGNPFFSTDTAAALRATEIDANIIFKATMVDGVYDKDPNLYPDAVKYDHVSHDQVLRQNLGVMDATAAALCRDNHVAIAVFSIADPDNILRMARGEKIGTIVS